MNDHDMYIYIMYIYTHLRLHMVGSCIFKTCTMALKGSWLRETP